jgi:hypothetical protein
MGAVSLTIYSPVLYVTMRNPKLLEVLSGVFELRAATR